MSPVPCPTRAPRPDLWLTLAISFDPFSSEPSVICSTSFGILRRRRVILLADREDPGWARSVLFGRSQKAAEERQRLGVHTEPAGATPSGEEYDYYLLDERSRSSADGPYWRQASRLVPCPTGEKTYLVMRVRGGQRAGGVSREVRKVAMLSIAKVFGVGDEKDLKIFDLMRGANKLRDGKFRKALANSVDRHLSNWLASSMSEAFTDYEPPRRGEDLKWHGEFELFVFSPFC